MNFFQKTRVKKASVANKECHAGEMMPYTHHWSKSTLLTEKEWLLKAIRLDGYSFETADDEDLDINKSIRNQLFRGIATGSCALYFHMIRRKQNIFDNNFSSANLANYFAEQLNQQWKRKNQSKQSFVNELYITIVRKADTKGVAAVGHLMKKLNQAASKEAWKSSMKDASEEIDEITSRIATSLRNYGPKILSTKNTRQGIFSEILEFLGKIVNFGSPQQLCTLIPTENLARYLPINRLYFGSKAIEILTSTGTRYGGIVSLKEYGQTTSAGMLDNFLQLPYEIVITQTFQFTNRQVAINKMQLQQNRLIQSEDKAVSQIAEISRALDDAMSGKVAFGEHHLTILCIERTLRSLENAISLMDSELTNTGVYSVREKTNLEPAFWSQLPANFDFVARKGVINTLNLASFVSLHNYPLGKVRNNHWGEAVTAFDTTSGTPFFFNFHVRDVGHTTIIGPTGAGKTVLMNFLCAQSMKFNPRIFFFDKDRGAEIFLRALGGVYTVLDSRAQSSFNPLQLEDNSENRIFLSEWLRQLVSTHGEQITPEDIAKINGAINGNYKLEKKDRTLRNLVPFFGIGGPGSLVSRVEMWHSGNSHSGLFDNDEDKLDFSQSSVFGFEMGPLLQDKDALGPTLLYIFHRISTSLDGSPTMIVLDEAWALIDNPIFAPKIKDWLKVMRKLNAMVIFATQSVEDAGKSAISDTLIQQTATQIFLPNLKATFMYRETFMLSEREFVLIRHTDPSTRFFLIKQAMQAVVARIDLAGMSDLINVLSGRAETVIILDEIINQVGSDPKAWLPVFYERAANA